VKIARNKVAGHPLKALIDSKPWDHFHDRSTAHEKSIIRSCRSPQLTLRIDRRIVVNCSLIEDGLTTIETRCLRSSNIWQVWRVTIVLINPLTDNTDNVRTLDVLISVGTCLQTISVRDPFLSCENEDIDICAGTKNEILHRQAGLVGDDYYFCCPRSCGA